LHGPIRMGQLITLIGALLITIKLDVTAFLTFGRLCVRILAVASLSHIFNGDTLLAILPGPILFILLILPQIRRAVQPKGDIFRPKFR
jgi:hypothetical protein